MDALKNYLITPLLNTFRFHKFKMFFVVFFTFLFYIVFFPYNQLSTFIENQISKSSRGQTQVSFDDLKLSLFPFGVSASDIYVFTPQMPSPLYIKKVYARPSFSDLLRFKTGGVFIAKDLLGGDLQLQISNLGQGTSKNKASKMIQISAELGNLDLAKTSTWFKAPINTGGKLSGDIDLTLDQMAYDQPKGRFNFQGKNILLPGTVKVQNMDLVLPEGQFKKVNVEAKIQDGQLVFQESTLGQPSDVIYGKFKGYIGLNARNLGGRLSVQPTNYEIPLDLNLDKQTEQKIGTLLTTILLNGQGGKSPTVDGGARYLFSVKGYPGSNPSFQPINSF